MYKRNNSEEEAWKLFRQQMAKQGVWKGKDLLIVFLVGLAVGHIIRSIYLLFAS